MTSCSEEEGFHATVTNLRCVT